MGWKGKLAAVVTLIVIVAVLLLYVNSGYNYANVSYGFDYDTQTVYFANVPKNIQNYLWVYYDISNSGTLGVVPTSTISTINASIYSIDMNGVSLSHNYCQNNVTLATISNLTVEGGGWFSAIIIITPYTGVQSFTVSVSATLPWDWFYWKNTIYSNYPTRLFYNQTEPNEYISS